MAKVKLNQSDYLLLDHIVWLLDHARNLNIQGFNEGLLVESGKKIDVSGVSIREWQTGANKIVKKSIRARKKLKVLMARLRPEFEKNMEK